VNVLKGSFSPHLFIFHIKVRMFINLLTASRCIFPALQRNSTHHMPMSCHTYPAECLPFVLVPGARNILSLAYVFVIGKKCWASIWLLGFFNDSG